MKDTANLDEAYLLYEERYNLTKLAEESGLDMDKFQAFSSKEKFFTLAYKLKDTEHFHLASFFFNKLFEILQSMEALLNKIDCLIILGEFEEAFRFNCLGFELFLELDEETPLIDDIEKTLSYQSEVFRQLINDGKINGTNPDIMAIHFYSPIFMLLFRYDLKDDKVNEALILVKEHIKEFFRLYLK